MTLKSIKKVWQDQAIRVIKVAFEKLKDQEMASFKGYKLYFRNVRDKKVLEEDDLDYLSTLNELKVEE
jgi:hypothetical protein